MISIQDLMRVANLKGYKIFENDSRPYNINHWGIRSSGGEFNDEFHLFWKHEGNWSHLIHKGTTDPGKYYLENPLNEKGCAILPEGQYLGGWELGRHKGAYDAWVQRKEVKVFRDNDRNAELDLNKLSDEGWYGINHHRAHAELEVPKIGKYSAGCQARLNPYEYAEFISVSKKASVIWGNALSYTLINIDDL